MTNLKLDQIQQQQQSVFYFQANWGRLDMKLHEKKTRAKKKKKIKGNKKTNQKGENRIKSEFKK
jgi:hypothetical protein